MSLLQQPHEQQQEQLLLQQKEKKVKKEKKQKKEVADATHGQQSKKKKRKEVAAEANVDIEDMFSFNVEWCKPEAGIFDFDALDAAEAATGLFDFDALDAADAAQELQVSSNSASSKLPEAGAHEEARLGAADDATNVAQQKEDLRHQIKTLQSELKQIDSLLEENASKPPVEAIAEPSELRECMPADHQEDGEIDCPTANIQFAWNVQAPAFEPTLFGKASHATVNQAVAPEVVIQKSASNMSWNVEAPAFVPAFLEGEPSSTPRTGKSPEMAKVSKVQAPEEATRANEAPFEKQAGGTMESEKVEKNTQGAFLRVPSPSRSRSPTKRHTSLRNEREAPSEQNQSASCTMPVFEDFEEAKQTHPAHPQESQTIAEQCAEYVIEDGNRSDVLPDSSKEVSESVSAEGAKSGLVSRIAGLIGSLTKRTPSAEQPAESVERHSKRRWKNLEKALLADMGPPVLETCPMQAAMDQMLKDCFLQAAKTRIRDSDLPMMGTTLYGTYMRSSRPIGTSCNVKDSSFRWVKDFLEHLESEGMLVLALGQSDPKVLRICRDHPALQQWEPWPRSETAASQKVRGR